MTSRSLDEAPATLLRGSTMILLTALTSSCCEPRLMTRTETVRVEPDRAWLQETPPPKWQAGGDGGDIVELIAECTKVAKDCNADKAKIKAWMDEDAPAD